MQRTLWPGRGATTRRAALVKRGHSSLPCFMTKALLVERDAHTVRLTLNRPDVRNALSRALNEELRSVAWSLAQDASVRFVLITGAGDKAFCAGADLKERKGVAASDAGPYIDAISGAIEAVAALPCATLALMNGAAYGGGLELALACDFRVLVDDADVGLTETRLGIMPGAGGSQRLPRLVGLAQAKELILLGRRISAVRALAIGLVNAVVPRAELATVASAWQADVEAVAPLSVRQAKYAMENGLHLPMHEALRLERQAYDVTLMSNDRNEGLLAFAEGRKPNYQGT